MPRRGSKGRYWCEKKRARVHPLKAFAVCLLRGCPHLWVRLVVKGRRK